MRRRPSNTIDQQWELHDYTSTVFHFGSSPFCLKSCWRLKGLKLYKGLNGYNSIHLSRPIRVSSLCTRLEPQLLVSRTTTCAEQLAGTNLAILGLMFSQPNLPMQCVPCLCVAQPEFHVRLFFWVMFGNCRMPLMQLLVGYIFALGSLVGLLRGTGSPIQTFWTTP